MGDARRLRGMITDELHPDMAAARRDLSEALLAALVKRPTMLDGEAIDDAYGIIDGHRAKWLMRGVRFPTMRILAFPRIGQIEIFRADLDRKAIEIVLVNMATKHPRLTAEEIAAACAHAWPDYRPEPGTIRRRRNIILPGDAAWTA